MKKIIVSLLLVFSMLLALVACDTFGEKDDPAKNVDYLVGVLNDGVKLSETENKAQQLDLDELLAELKKAEFELDVAADMDGEVQNAYVGFKDMVLYSKTADGTENYAFILDDWTLVEVAPAIWGDGYYGVANTTIKDALSLIESSESSIPENSEVPTAVSMVGEIFEVIKNADIPDAAAEDVEYKDGKYYLSDNYIKKVINSYVDVFFNEFGADLGMTSGDILDAKAVVKGYLDYISAEVYFYVECESIDGIGASIKMDETFAAEKLGYSEVYASFDVFMNKVAFDVRVANSDSVLADVSVDVETVVNGDKAERFDLDVNAKVSVPGYEFNEETYEMIETVQNVALSVDMSADFVKMSQGNGEFMTFATTLSGDGENVTISAKASSSEKGNRISASASATMNGEAVSVTVNMQNKSADRMPEIPAEVIDAKDQAVAGNGAFDYWN